MKAVSVLLAMLMLVTSGKGLASNVGDTERQQEIACLASNIYYEARGESTKGQLAVGLVTINRTKDDRYPDTICGVVREKGQFSWYKPGSIKAFNNDAYRNVMTKATMLYDDYYVGDTFKDFIGGATHFHNVGVKPRWSNQRMTIQIGAHAFYTVSTPWTRTSKSGMSVSYKWQSLYRPGQRTHPQELVQSLYDQTRLYAPWDSTVSLALLTMDPRSTLIARASTSKSSTPRRTRSCSPTSDSMDTLCTCTLSYRVPCVLAT